MSPHLIIYIIILIFKKNIFYLIPFSFSCLSPLFPALCPIASVLEKLMDLISTSDPRPGQSNQKGFMPSPVRGMFALPTIPTLGATSKMHPKRVMSWRNQLEGLWGGTLIRPLQKPLRSWQVGTEIYWSCRHQDKPHSLAY